MRLTRRIRRAMTLLEVMVALSIMGLIGMLTWTSLAGTLDARDILAEEDGVQRGARIALARMRRELELAYLTPNTTAVNTYRTVFVGTDEEPIDQLWFATLAHQRLYRDSRECDQAEVTLWGEDDPEEGAEYVLLHRESPRVDQDPDLDGKILPLAYDVRRLDLHYLDPKTGEWEDEWDSTGVDQANRLPRAVHVTLVLMGPDPDDEDDKVEHTFTTMILLQFADRLQQSVFATGSQQGLDIPLQ